jgi:3',5'-nucleoside bisphosphate phosphatase
VRWYKADLHIHSVLSPCGSLEMGPRAVLSTARQKNIDLLAITDHNSAANLPAYAALASEYEIVLIPGLEVQSAEEIHTLVFFHDMKSCQAFSRELYDSLLSVKNEPDFFGDQVVIDSEENILRYEEKALINSSRWNFEQLLEKINSAGGFALPAHVDAHSYSIISQLGFIPESKDIVALGISAKCDVNDLYKKFPELKDFCLIRNSDAHYLRDIGSGTTEFYLKEPTLHEIILACKKKGDRNIKI